MIGLARLAIVVVLAAGGETAAQIVGGALDYRVDSDKRDERSDTADAAVDRDAFERSMNELFVTSESIREQPGAEEWVEFDGGDEPRWLQGLTVTHSDNPMLAEQCREAALEANVKRLQEEFGFASGQAALEETVAHMHQHRAFIDGDRISHAAYLEHLANCEQFCAPLVASLMECHVLSVARHPHGLILFELGSSQVRPRYAAGVIREMVEAFEANPDLHILLVGRASRIGDLRYNRRLAGQRALAVRDHLIEAGVPFERIRPIWFGWEPPQIDAFIAREYGVAELFEEVGLDGINQSVVMVLHE